MKIRDADIHNHLLPGVDDGFRNIEDSLKAIKRMAEAGCREFVFTPHMNPDVYPDVGETIHREAYEVLRQRIPSEWGITTALAAEYMVVNGFEDRVSSRADELLVYSDGSILIEMSYYYRSPNLERAVFELNMAGLKPIIAHPERYSYMVDCLEDFSSLYDKGCRFQINYLSLTGTYGKSSIKILNYLRKNGMCDFFSSDLHSLTQLDRILDSRIIFPLRKFRNI